LPTWSFPPAIPNWYSGRMWRKVIITAVEMAFVGLVESMLTVKIVNRITGPPLGSTRMECMGQAVGNIVSGLFGTQGGCALIGQSLINIGTGAHRRTSSITAAITLLVCVLFLSPIVGQIPVAALMGIMFLVSVNTFTWSWLKLLVQLVKGSDTIHWCDAVVMVLVTVCTVLFNLAVAVLVGLFVSALSFAWSMSKDTQVTMKALAGAKDTCLITVSGRLFFASVTDFQNKLQADQIFEKHLVLDFSKCKIQDHSALDSILLIASELKTAGKTTTYQGLSPTALEYMRIMSDSSVVKVPSDAPRSK